MAPMAHPPPPRFPTGPNLAATRSAATSMSSFRSDYSLAEAVSAESLDAMLAPAEPSPPPSLPSPAPPTRTPAADISDDDLETESSESDSEEELDDVVTHWARPYTEELTASGGRVYADYGEVDLPRDAPREQAEESDGRVRVGEGEGEASPRRNGRLPPPTPHAGFTTPVVLRAAPEGEDTPEEEEVEEDVAAVVVHDVSSLLNSAVGDVNGEFSADAGNGVSSSDAGAGGVGGRGEGVDGEGGGSGESFDEMPVVYAEGTELEPDEEARFVSGGREMFARSRNEAMIWGGARSPDAWAAGQSQQREEGHVGSHVVAHRRRVDRAARMRAPATGGGRRRSGDVVTVTTTTTTTMMAVGDGHGEERFEDKLVPVMVGAAGGAETSGGASNASSFSTASGGVDGEGEVVVTSVGGRSDGELTTTTVTPPPSGGSAGRRRRKSSAAKPRPAVRAEGAAVERKTRALGEDDESALIVPRNRFNGRARSRSISRENGGRAGEAGKGRAVRGLSVLLSRTVDGGLRDYGKLIKAVGCSMEGETPIVVHAREALASAYKMADKESQFSKTPRQRPRAFPPVDDSVVAWGGKALKDRKGKGEVLFGSAFGFGNTVAIVAGLMAMEGNVVPRGPVRMGAEARLGASMEVEVGVMNAGVGGKVAAVAVIAARADGTGVDVRMRSLNDTRLTLKKAKRRKAFLAMVDSMEASWKCVGWSAGLTSKQKAAAALLSAARARAAMAKGAVGGPEHLLAIQAVAAKK